MTFQPDFTRYLLGKTTVDDRALNRHVWDTLAAALPPQQEKPLRVLEIGAGIGTMIERIAGRGVLRHAEYTAIDALPENIRVLRERVPQWAEAQGWQVAVETPETGDAFFHLSRGADEFVARSQALDLFDLLARPEAQGAYDLLVAHAVLDLFDLPRVLPRLVSLVRPGGLLYLTINYDGATIFEPAVERRLDALIERLYHETMDKRVTNGARSGDSRAGRHLFSLLRASHTDILAAGSSDWVVCAGPEGYPTDEAYFLHFILETICGALEHHPALDPAVFREWIAARHAQVDAGALVYIAHQLDFLARRMEG